MIMGSDSDWSVDGRRRRGAGRIRRPTEVRVVSAHRTRC
ncbi:AIR carboxylase family protein [Mycobacterium kansasii]|uniref:AIR carboxylase family protein n=1 Tax=Mycobacterium kansasii TaxID=1768 RepID=A0A1V3XRY4_MYCKA|nr:AIR carboxylase family protein [Mycobacterium kansasii]